MFHITQHEMTFNELNLFSSFLPSQYLHSAPSIKEGGGCCTQPKITENKLHNNLRNVFIIYRDIKMH